MKSSITEKDWKYLRSIHDELLNSLCQRINLKTVDILSAQGKSEHEKYLSIFGHMRDSDDTIAKCFDDWRRSTIGQRLISLHRQGLLTKSHILNLTPETQDFIKFWETL